MKRFPILFLSIYIFPLFCFAQSPEHKAMVAVSGMFDSIKHVHTLSMHIVAVERRENKIDISRSEVKIQNHPKKIYFIDKENKTEILFNEETNNSKALVKVRTFPYIPVMLDPRGSTMRKNHHYSIFELGFDFFYKSVAQVVKKNEGWKNFTWKGKIIKDNQPCHLIEYEVASFSYKDYVVSHPETINLIAAKLYVSENIIRFKNKMINNFDLLPVGTVLKVPNYYCKKAVICIGEKNLLPVSISIFDEDGLLESYEFQEAKVNHTFKANEFNRNNKDYNF